MQVLTKLELNNLYTLDYLKMNEQLHEKNKHYGTSGVHYIDDVVKLMQHYRTSDVLDYGCGKSTLAMNLPFKIKQYDPAIKKYSSIPAPADIVVCTDVLEHIEPVCINNVLTHIKVLTQRVAYIAVCTHEASKTLPDGRNAHLLVKPFDWWSGKISSFFEIINSTEKNTISIFICEKTKEI